MIKQVLMEGFNNSISGRNRVKAEVILKNDLVKDIKINVDNHIIDIISSVISESLFNEYSCKIEIDSKTKEVIGTYCSCTDFERKEFSKDNYCCKHLIASFYYFLNSLDNDANLKEKLLFLQKSKDDNQSVFSKAAKSQDLLSSLLEDNKENVKFEITLNRNTWSSKLQAEFKIGLKSCNNKMYVLKDINQFLTCMYNKMPIKYGKDFIFDIRKQNLSFDDRRLIKFIYRLSEKENLQSSFKRSQDKIINGKTLTIPDILVKTFLDIIKNHRVYLGDGFFCRIIDSEILYEDIPIPFSLCDSGNNIILEVPNGMPEALTQDEDVFLYGTSIYVPSTEQSERLVPYLKVFNNTQSIAFGQNDEKRVLKELIPSIQNVSNGLNLSKKLKNKVVIAPVIFKFYFDKDRENVYLTLKVSYGGYEFNYFEEFKEKVIYRYSQKEKEVYKLVKKFGFEDVNNKFIFLKDDDYIFRFFKYDIERFQDYGEVFYSENFKGIRNISKSDFKGDVRKGKFDYFEFEFILSDLSKEETTNILRSFRSNLKYYKLENGEFLDLEDKDLKEILTLLDNLLLEETLNNNTIALYKNKGIYLEQYLEDKDFRFITGREKIMDIRDKLKNIKNKSFQPPYGIQAELREYQRDGYNWFRTLDYLGFGGILGDEMGLGKTLQTIVFLLSKENSHALIVAPTSLIYNWFNEFKKFAPSMKVCIVNSNKEEREELIKAYNNYDVIITTYNLLRRDLDLYDMVFDYCILDEAQNIKNASSQNAKAVKSIKSKSRFALTGTPIENSLMELWSIFDFIMPGYLYDEKRFTSRYYRRLEEEKEILEEINRLVKPFILRRYKKNVIKELPDKIEKRLIIPLSDEQKLVYKTYSEYAKDLIQKKVEDDEFKNSKIEILSYITKLRQICLDPSVIMENYLGTSGKIDALLEILDHSISSGHKILVFSQFTSVLKNIGNLLKENNILFSYLDGSVSSINRMRMVDDFNDGENNVFLVSLKAGGTGLNLTSADIVIHFDPWWNPAVEDQATDRAHRIGQENTVEVIKLIAQGTIEEKIVELQDSKRKLIDTILGDDLNIGSFINTLNEEQIINLFN
ncbi:DEAD/DEAH box helicase [Clostridium botulinum]|uniref:DEAD/DEAH box helicase n=1 Tax=Clostridium botulinum TaxID=1491 RepID=A0A0M1LU66_CLOBO|nr:DEAD/DEAH box helicase [Clostridium botulinum]KAI3347285.1 DEAD/DEAH box helicase [Clostridium botulinum]KOM89541.1 helicase [Clostridium botulinum]KOR61209.1 helicase [Clostridium botulinum]MCS6109664.1 DEAD/DEAH box helicase [Clostridium botulinum]NFE13332.1 DEAD/DEAH box helicase [Clostridium botulinum]